MNETIRLILDRIQGCRRCADCGRFDDWLFNLESGEIEAIAKAYDELLAYYEVVGFEGDLDDEEMPSGIIPDALGRLRGLLDRYARWESLAAIASRHGGVVECEPVRFSYFPDTPPSGPSPASSEDAAAPASRSGEAQDA